MFPNLKERQGHYGNQLSGGEQQMLAIGRALMTNPQLLILDEATEGLAPLIRAEIYRSIERLKAEGLSILVIDKDVKALTRGGRPPLRARKGPRGLDRDIAGTVGAAGNTAPVPGYLIRDPRGILFFMGNLASPEALLARWDELCQDPSLRDLPYKIELNSWGKVEMSPASVRHGLLQAAVVTALARRLKAGVVLTECPILTAIGIRVPDVVWASRRFMTLHRGLSPLPSAPRSASKCSRAPT